MRCVLIVTVIMAAMFAGFGEEPLKGGTLPAGGIDSKKDPDCAIEVEKCIKRVLHSLHPKGSEGENFALEERMAGYNVPGVSIAVIHEGRLSWARGFGQAKAGSDRPVTPNTLFQAASLSKPVTAAAALKLATNGPIDLDTDINHYLESWQIPASKHAASQPVTLRHLLGHMAGMNVSGFPGYPQGKEVPSLRQVLDGEPPANNAPIRIKQPPGDGWKYSGGGYTVVQQFLMDVYGDSFQELMSRLVLDPAGMDDSTFEQPLPRNMWQRAAVGHLVTGVPIKGNWHIYPELAAAGLWTTPSDLARFAIAVQNSARETPDSVLPRKAANLLLTPQYGSFSLGLAIRGRGQARWFYHNGANAGFRCLMYGYLDTGEGAVVMTNSDNGMELAQEIVNAIAEVYDWPGFEPEN